MPQLAACSPPSKCGTWTVPDDDLRGESPTWPGCEALTGPLSLYPYLILSQFKHDLCVCPFFYLACLPLCVCCVCLLSLIQSLFVPMSVSALWSCVSLSLTISLPVPLCRCVLPPAPHWDSVSVKEARFWKPDPLGYLERDLHFQGLQPSPGSLAPPISAQPPVSLV